MKVGSGNKLEYSTVIEYKKSYFIVAYTLLTLASAGRWTSNEPPSLYVFINCSTRELGTIEKYVVWHLHRWKEFHLLPFK